MAFDNARIYYEMDYRRYARQDASVDLPQRKSANNDRFNPSDKYSGISGYDPIYNATECDLNRGRIIGIDTSERWDPFHHPFYFDADSNLVYGGSRDLRDSPFEQAVRRAYEQCLKRHNGKKPAPTLKKHYIGDSGQQSPPGKMLNSKAAGRLLAAGGVYNGNVAGFRKTAEQLGGDAVKGYDQVLNEKTSGSMIAAASVLLAKKARTSQTLEKLNSYSGKLRGEVSVLENINKIEIKYTKRSPDETMSLRKEFNQTIRKKFLSEISSRPELLKKFSGAELEAIKNGTVPKGWQVHHKYPLDDSGSNNFENLILIKNEPYHKVLTNLQTSTTRGIKPGESKIVSWVIPSGIIYPNH
ncbi:HNH endonuclease [Erwinia rhapontici]|uniref:HNH endonuclease n=1 Tax=Erwinia rhapontici TaxID=55212 RepID=UPI003BA19516